MSVGGYILAIAFLVAVGMIVAWPLIMNTREKPIKPKHDQAPLQSQYDAVVMSLRDLDFDYQTGKLLEADYQLQRERLVQLGADLLRNLDQVPSATPQQSSKA